jgi:trigger factor
LIQNEIKRAKEDLMKRMGENNSQVKLEDIPDDLFKDASEARVQLGLIVNAIVEKNKLEASDEKVTAMIEEMASVYEDAEEVKAHYRDNEKDRENIKGAVIEDELVEFVLNQAKVTEKETDFFELIRTTMANSQM